MGKCGSILSLYYYDITIIIIILSKHTYYHINVLTHILPLICRLMETGRYGNFSSQMLT